MPRSYENVEELDDIYGESELQYIVIYDDGEDSRIFEEMLGPLFFNTENILFVSKKSIKKNVVSYFPLVLRYSDGERNVVSTDELLTVLGI